MNINFNFEEIYCNCLSSKFNKQSYKPDLSDNDTVHVNEIVTEYDSIPIEVYAIANVSNKITDIPYVDDKFHDIASVKEDAIIHVEDFETANATENACEVVSFNEDVLVTGKDNDPASTNALFSVIDGANEKDTEQFIDYAAIVEYVPEDDLLMRM